MASALAMKPEILILDEPTSNLDPIGKEEVFSVTRSLNQEEGLTVIIAEHEVEVIAEFADKLILLDEGKITKLVPLKKYFQNLLTIKDVGQSPSSHRASIKKYELFNEYPHLEEL